jgi:hypothetical protein
MSSLSFTVLALFPTLVSSANFRMISTMPSWIWIRIRNLNADPNLDPATQINADPKPWFCQKSAKCSNVA